MTERDKPKLTTDEELQARTIGELKPLTAPILVTDYNPDWPSLYEREAARVRGILGDRVKLLEHAGSTSVVDLPAKPIIDMVLAVADSSDEATYVPDMERGGYVLRIREPHWFEHRLFKGPSTSINLHVFSAGCPEIDQMLLFRDWLRRHPDDRELYAATKRELAKQNWKFSQHYADAKTEIVHEILARARAAGAAVGGPHARLLDALVIIDMQVASFAEGTKHDVPGVVHRINLLSGFVREAGGIVVFVQHDGADHEHLVPNTPGWQVLPALETRPSDLFVRKTMNDAFAGTLLSDELLKVSAKTVAIAGWATDYCVDSTVRSAASRGFRVVVPSDAHTVSDRAHLTAQQIIDHHNRTWAGLIAKPPVHIARTEELVLRRLPG